MTASVAAVVLAAGKAERAGCNKLRLELAGRSILHRVVTTALASQAGEVVVVVGHHAAELAREIPRDGRVKVVYNSRYEEGQHSSLKAGLASLDADSEAVVVLLGDQPFVTAEAIDSIICEFQRRRAPVVVPVYGETRGHPVLFSRTLFHELTAASEDQGRRAVMRRHQAENATVAVAGESPLDVDTWQDYVLLSGHAETRGSEGEERQPGEHSSRG